MTPGTLIVPAAICAAAISSCWVLSLLTREHSWVDRLWSIIPIVYAGWFAYAGGGTDFRLNGMAFLVAAWGARLTFNFWRKGGYAPGGEDYRWAELRRRMSPLQFQIFNFVFVCVVQNALLLAITLPAAVALAHAGVAPRPLDGVAVALVVFFLVGETIADEQQWRFQSNKTAGVTAGERLEQGFLTTGLFRYSRHPNFFCEQATWWSLCLFGVSASGAWINVALVGPVALTLLFHGSTNFTEELSERKYPAYAAYKRRTSRLIPWWPARD